MNSKHYKYFCWSLFSIVIAVNGTISARADDATFTQTNVSENDSIYLSKDHRNAKDKSREYTFKAPDNKTLSNNRQLTAAQGYKVEVYGSAAGLLVQVRDIEPRAFIKGNIIQVGIFSQQNNAEDMVRKLAVAGFWARIVSP